MADENKEVGAAVPAGEDDACVSEGGSVSFECILSAISDVRSGNVGVNTVRKLIKQVDNALSSFSGTEDDPSGPFGSVPSYGIDGLCDEVESQCKSFSGAAEPAGINPALASLLALLLKAVLEKWLK